MALLDRVVRYVLSIPELEVHELVGTIRPERAYRLDLDALVDELEPLLIDRFEHTRLETSRGDTTYSASVLDNEVTLDIELHHYSLEDKFDRREHRTLWHSPRARAGGDSVSLVLRSSDPDVVDRVAELLVEHEEYDLSISGFS